MINIQAVEVHCCRAWVDLILGAMPEGLGKGWAHIPSLSNVPISHSVVGPYYITFFRVIPLSWSKSGGIPIGFRTIVLTDLVPVGISRDSTQRLAALHNL
jgi:hypothetical protein